MVRLLWGMFIGGVSHAAFLSGPKPVLHVATEKKAWPGKGDDPAWDGPSHMDDIQDAAKYHKDYPKDTNPVVNTSNGSNSSNSSKTFLLSLHRDPAWDGPSTLDEIQDNATYHKDYPNDTHPVVNKSNNSKAAMLIHVRDPAWDGPSKIDDVQSAEEFHKDFVSNDTGVVAKNVSNGSKAK